MKQNKQIKTKQTLSNINLQTCALAFFFKDVGEFISSDLNRSRSDLGVECRI